MFLVASTGRCGTAALAGGLTGFSDHELAHEPSPLLREAWRKHRHRPWWTAAYRARMGDYRAKARARARYGETFRTANLLPDVRRWAGPGPLLVLARDPEGYVRSAHALRVLSRGDAWDTYRLLPRDLDPSLPLAVRIAEHWITVNRYLLAEVDRHPRARVVRFQPLEPVIDDWSAFLGVTITDRAGLTTFLEDRPNRSTSFDEPEGFELVAPRCRALWDEVQRRAG